MNDEEVIIIESIVILKKIKYKGIVWVPESEQTKKQPKSRRVDNINNNFTTPVEKHVKQNYFVKWMKKNKLVGDVFTKDDFYKEFPKHKTDMGCKRRVDEALQTMILDGCITVHDNIPGKYRVLKI